MNSAAFVITARLRVEGSIGMGWITALSLGTRWVAAGHNRALWDVAGHDGTSQTVARRDGFSGCSGFRWSAMGHGRTGGARECCETRTAPNRGQSRHWLVALVSTAPLA